jgi:hypothetical protein
MRVEGREEQQDEEEAGRQCLTGRGNSRKAVGEIFSCRYSAAKSPERNAGMRSSSRYVLDSLPFSRDAHYLTPACS